MILESLCSLLAKPCSYSSLAVIIILFLSFGVQKRPDCQRALKSNFPCLYMGLLGLSSGSGPFVNPIIFLLIRISYPFRLHLSLHRLMKMSAIVQCCRLSILHALFSLLQICIRSIPHFQALTS